ncbi:MAG: DivIVA domain-containing protein [Desulforhopalus sp.]|nr:DivIVA domain-containing protein [Desulforhopalus sp.]
MLTPQAIKDQDFQIKFRGYDAIEVKAYLELLAEDFFELNEQNRLQMEEIDSLITKRDILQKEVDGLAAEVRLSRENAEGIQAAIDSRFQLKDKEIADLLQQVEAAKTAAQALEDENRVLQRKVVDLENKIAGGAGATLHDHAEIDKLNSKIALLEEQNQELKQQGLDFKTTILAAQKFADNLRQSSEEEAQRMMEKAKSDVQRFREEANAELSRLPKEIEKLHQQRIKVREELRAMLHSYLEALEIFPGHEKTDKEDDLSDLFESILLPDDDSSEPDDIENITMDL